MTTVSAAWRFKPRPPALVLSRKMKYWDPGSLNFFSRAARSSDLVVPEGIRKINLPINSCLKIVQSQTKRPASLRNRFFALVRLSPRGFYTFERNFEHLAIKQRETFLKSWRNAFVYYPSFQMLKEFKHFQWGTFATLQILQCSYTNLKLNGNFWIYYCALKHQTI